MVDGGLGWVYNNYIESIKLPLFILRCRMITYEDCLVDIGYNEIGNAPELIVEYFAYKNGEVRRFSVEEEARSFSSLVERVVTNRDEIDIYRETKKALRSEAIHIFENAVKEELAPDFTNGLWNLCWSAAYDRSHSDGYDNVAQSAQHYVDFANNVIHLSRAVDNLSQRIKQGQCSYRMTFSGNEFESKL